MRTAIFDLDGTLADTSLDLLAAANACFDRDWLDPEHDRATAFQGGRAMLRVALARRGTPWSEEEVDAHYPRLLSHYEANIDRHTTLFPGVVAALDKLAADEWRLGVCTLKPEGLANLLLTRLGIRGRFHALTGADTLPVKKPDPGHLTGTIALAQGDPARAVLVGDSQTDRDTAKAADIPCVLVTFRPASVDVHAMDAAGNLDHFDNLPKLVSTLV